MVALRSPIPDFQLANPLYRGAQVVFYLASDTGQITATTAELFGEPTGSLRVTNPQTLDGDGKFNRPVYIESAVIGVIVGANVESHSTGVIYPRGTFRGAWATGRRFTAGDIITNAAGDNLYAVANDFVGGATFAADLTAGLFVFVLGMQIANAARDTAVSAAAAASTSATNAAASALLAQQAAGSVDAQTIAARFLALENRADVLEGEDYRSEQIALGIAYQGVR